MLKELDQRVTDECTVTWAWENKLQVHQIKVDCKDGRLFTLFALNTNEAKDMFVHPFVYEGDLLEA